jgi:RNA polymerase sigma-70 factor (ECF subfamily)
MDGGVEKLPGPLAGLDVGAPLDADLEQALAASTSLAFRVAYAVLRRRDDAEDVAQEAVLRACRKLGSLRDPGRMRAWLARIAWRLALDRRRGERRREDREQAAWEASPPEPTVEEAAIRRQAERGVWDAVDALPEKLRMVVVLASIEGHDVRDVAALLRVPEGTVKSRLHLARRRLAEALRWLVNDTRRA